MLKQLVVISPESNVRNETAIVSALFDEGLEYFHLRKPGFTKEEQEEYLSEIKPEYLKKISLHQYRNMTMNNQISRFHFKESERTSPPAPSPIGEGNGRGEVRFSTSVHETGTLETLSSRWDYVFLGPIFSSISKPGYENKSLQTSVIKKKNGMPKIIAIGGIDKSNAGDVLKRGFDGIAVLGSIWTNLGVSVNVFKSLKVLCNA